jgi:3-deoxy-manno-octulosonate cytidylyltransferase (CMP-KDO synthetase)
MVWHVVERARRARKLSRVLVATDDARIRDAVRERGGEAVMTSPDHLSGTDRVAEAAGNIEADVVVNIQGDEPLIEPDDLDRLVEALDGDEGARIATLRRPAEPAEMPDPIVVKVVCNAEGRALYFSRAPIPHRTGDAAAPRWTHIGVYAFRRADLLAFAELPPAALEREEGLEQLRALEQGWAVRVVDAAGRFIGVDTAEDLKRAEMLMNETGGGKHGD